MPDLLGLRKEIHLTGKFKFKGRTKISELLGNFEQVHYTCLYSKKSDSEGILAFPASVDTAGYQKPHNFFMLS